MAKLALVEKQDYGLIWYKFTISSIFFGVIKSLKLFNITNKWITLLWTISTSTVLLGKALTPKFASLHAKKMKNFSPSRSWRKNISSRKIRSSISWLKSKFCPKSNTRFWSGSTQPFRMKKNYTLFWNTVLVGNFLLF